MTPEDPNRVRLERMACVAFCCMAWALIIAAVAYGWSVWPENVMEMTR